jgi:hypothetical protein
MSARSLAARPSAVPDRKWTDFRRIGAREAMITEDSPRFVVKVAGGNIQALRDPRLADFAPGAKPDSLD